MPVWILEAQDFNSPDREKLPDLLHRLEAKVIKDVGFLLSVSSPNGKAEQLPEFYKNEGYENYPWIILRPYGDATS